MSQITSPATYSISRPQDVIDIVNKNSAINTSIGVIFIALGGILIDAYQAAVLIHLKYEKNREDIGLFGIWRD